MPTKKKKTNRMIEVDVYIVNCDIDINIAICNIMTKILWIYVELKGII